MENDYEYLEIDVSRKESTCIYLKVPKGWKPYQNYMLVGKAAEETTSDSDWDNFGWEKDIEIEGSKVIGEIEAEKYYIFDVAEHLKNKK